MMKVKDVLDWLTKNRLHDLEDKELVFYCATCERTCFLVETDSKAMVCHGCWSLLPFFERPHVTESARHWEKHEQVAELKRMMAK